MKPVGGRGLMGLLRDSWIAKTVRPRGQEGDGRCTRYRETGGRDFPVGSGASGNNARYEVLRDSGGWEAPGDTGRARKNRTCLQTRTQNHGGPGGLTAARTWVG